MRFRQNENTTVVDNGEASLHLVALADSTVEARIGISAQMSVGRGKELKCVAAQALSNLRGRLNEVIKSLESSVVLLPAEAPEYIDDRPHVDGKPIGAPPGTHPTPHLQSVSGSTATDVFGINNGGDDNG